MELCTQLKTRFDLHDKKLNLLKYLDPMKIASGTMPSISSLLKEFPYSDADHEILNIQFRSLIWENALLDKDIAKFCANLENFKNKNDESMLTYKTTLSCLPHSSATAERNFSDLNSIKNYTLNRLEVKTVENILFCKDICNDGNKDCIFEPTKELVNFARTFNYHNGIHVRNISSSSNG